MATVAMPTHSAAFIIFGERYTGIKCFILNLYSDFKKNQKTRKHTHLKRFFPLEDVMSVDVRPQHLAQNHFDRKHGCCWDQTPLLRAYLF